MSLFFTLSGRLSTSLSSRLSEIVANLSPMTLSDISWGSCWSNICTRLAFWMSFRFGKTSWLRLLRFRLELELDLTVLLVTFILFKLLVKLVAGCTGTVLTSLLGMTLDSLKPLLKGCGDLATKLVDLLWKIALSWANLICSSLTRLYGLEVEIWISSFGNGLVWDWDLWTRTASFFLTWSIVIKRLMLLRASVTSFSLLIPVPDVLNIFETSALGCLAGGFGVGVGDGVWGSAFFSKHWFQYLKAMGLVAFSTASGLGVNGGGVGDRTLEGVGHWKYPSFWKLSSNRGHK